MHEDMKDLKNSFEAIEVPSEIDFIIEKAIHRGKRARKQRILKPLGTIAASIIIFIFTVNASPAFAGYVSKVPGLESLVKLVQFDKGLKKAAIEGMGQVINKSVTQNGITLTVESLLFDGRNLLVAYEIKSDRELQRLGVPRFELTDPQGKRLEVSASLSSPQGENNNLFKGLLQFGHEGFIYPEDIVVACSSIEHIYDTPHGSKRESIAGDWKVNVKLDKELATIEPKYLELNKNFNVDNLNFTVEYLKIYPTVIDVKLVMDSNNPQRVTFFKNLRLIDENGNEYKSNSAHHDDYEYTGHFESSYFTNPKELTLAFDAVYTMPREDKYIVIDIENEKILDDSGYKVEFLRKNLHTNYMEGKKELDVWFTINDEGFLNNDHKFLWLSHEVYDENGKIYNIGVGHTTGEKGTGEYALMFDVESSVPKIVKAKIDGISKGIIKPIRVNLK